jgi:hypothetical protein
MTANGASRWKAAGEARRDARKAGRKAGRGNGLPTAEPGPFAGRDGRRARPSRRGGAKRAVRA